MQSRQIPVYWQCTTTSSIYRNEMKWNYNSLLPFFMCAASIKTHATEAYRILLIWLFIYNERWTSFSYLQYERDGNNAKCIREFALFGNSTLTHKKTAVFNEYRIFISNNWNKRWSRALNNFYAAMIHYFLRYFRYSLLLWLFVCVFFLFLSQLVFVWCTHMFFARLPVRLNSHKINISSRYSPLVLYIFIRMVGAITSLSKVEWQNCKHGEEDKN